MTRRPIGAVCRARGMHGKGLGVCDISRRLGIPHQTISDWISGRWREGRKQFHRVERPEAPGFSAEAKRKIRREPLDPVLREIITGVAGEHGCEVVRALLRKEVTDDKVAKLTDMRVNLVRKILYDLYDNRVVSYRRTRDEQSGWYIYYWRIEPERAREYFNNNKRLLMQKLEGRLETERNAMLFSCQNDCPKSPFELAAENDFKCKRCGGKLERYDNSGVITALERQIESLRQHLLGA